MRHLKKYRYTLAMSLSLLLYCTPALAQDPDPLPTSPTPMPFNAGSSSSATDGAGAPASENPRAQAALLLSGYHDVPPKTVFDTTLDKPQQLLMDFARDESILPLQRQRALEALAYYADAQVEALYRDLLTDTNSAEMVRHRVMSLLATNFPKTALPMLEPFLAHPDLQYRLSAINAIGRIPGADAHQALQAAAKSETQKVAQARLAKLLRVAR